MVLAFLNATQNKAELRKEKSEGWPAYTGYETISLMGPKGNDPLRRTEKKKERREGEGEGESRQENERKREKGGERWEGFS